MNYESCIRNCSECDFQKVILQSTTPVRYLCTKKLSSIFTFWFKYNECWKSSCFFSHYSLPGKHELLHGTLSWFPYELFARIVALVEHHLAVGTCHQLAVDASTNDRQRVLQVCAIKVVQIFKTRFVGSGWIIHNSLVYFTQLALFVWSWRICRCSTQKLQNLMLLCLNFCVDFLWQFPILTEEVLKSSWEWTKNSKRHISPFL